MESIHIENFGGIKEMTLDINKINILIGPQASGKSVTAKLVYFFKKIPSIVLSFLEIKHIEPDFKSFLKDRFLTYFPKGTWSSKDFLIEYRTSGGFIRIVKTGSRGSFKIVFSKTYEKAIEKAQSVFSEHVNFKNFLKQRTSEDQVVLQDQFYKAFQNDISTNTGYMQFFVPAGRSFFAQLQTSIFTMLNTNQSLDPYLLEFGSLYESLKNAGIDNKKLSKNVEILVNEILSGAYVRRDNRDWIYHNDGRHVALSNASSGQQETVPMLFLLSYLPFLKFTNGGATLFIEEPEAHLFPDSQKKIVQLLSRISNSKEANFQLFITTHSPYILSSFNNLMEAGKIANEQPEKQKQIEKVVPREEWLNPNDLNASSIFSGKKTSLIDPVTKLIAQNHLDSVSDDLAIDFGKLLDIEY